MHDVPILVSKAIAMGDGIRVTLDVGFIHICIEGNQSISY